MSHFMMRPKFHHPSPASNFLADQRLLNVFVPVYFRLPQFKYIPCRTQRILIQIVDVHYFPEISDTHKHPQSFVRKADCMRNVADFWVLELFQLGEETPQVFPGRATELFDLLLRSTGPAEMRIYETCGGHVEVGMTAAKRKTF